MKTLLKSAVAALGVSLIGLSANASAQGYQPERIMQSVQEADLEAIVLAMGHTVQQRQPMGPRSIRAATPNGLIYFLAGDACDQGGVQGCLAINMQVRVEAPATATVSSTLRASDQHPGLNIWVNREDRVLGLTRYVVVQGGVTMANLAFNLNTLLNLTPSAVRTVANEQTAAAQ